MISYRQFRNLHETDAVPPATATPATAAPNVEELERQIDALFDELKQRIRGMYTPRKDWMQELQAWAAGPKTEHLSLEYYHALDQYFTDFQEALNSSDLMLVDRLVDEYKAKFKQIMGTYKQQMAAAAAAAPAARTRKPRRRPEPGAAPAPAATPVEEPARVEPEPAPAARVEPEPAPATRSDPVAPVRTEPEPEPAPAATEKGTEITPEEAELMKLGAIIVFWHDNLGGTVDEIPPEDMSQLEKDFEDYDPKKHIDDKDYLIKIAKEYKAGREPAVDGGPMKGAIETKPGEDVVAPPATTEAATAPTREKLIAMSPDDFKKFIMDSANPWSDPQIDEMYEGMEWWKPGRMRKEVVDNYLMALEDRMRKRESLQHYVQRFKNLLRQPNRPQFLLKEAVKLPIKERIDFYRQKLSCRGT